MPTHRRCHEAVPDTPSRPDVAGTFQFVVHQPTGPRPAANGASLGEVGLRVWSAFELAYLVVYGDRALQA